VTGNGSDIMIRVRVNGSEFAGMVAPEMLLVHFLRERLGLIGTNIGCETSYCGACTVLTDGRAVKSCTMFAVQADGSGVLTIEGIDTEGSLHPVAAAFLASRALQCGYCTPGMIMSALALLTEVPSPTRDEIRRAIEGNLCRCTGYQNIVDAVERAAAVQCGEAPPALDAGDAIPGGGREFRGR